MLGNILAIVATYIVVVCDFALFVVNLLLQSWVGVVIQCRCWPSIKASRFSVLDISFQNLAE